MFNSTVYKHESKVVAVTKEIERSVSPDKVADIYELARQEAEKRIVQRMTMSGNGLECSVIVTKDPASMTMTVTGHFMLNDKPIDFSSILPSKVSAISQKGMREFVFEALSKEMHKHLLRNLEAMAL